MSETYLPGVVAAKYVKDYVIDVTFNDGTHKRIDVSQWFKGPVFEPLRDKAFFKKFFVEAATVAWPNGVDIAPETLYDADDVAPKTNRTSGRPGAKARRKK
jgi:hypothetical protein